MFWRDKNTSRQPSRPPKLRPLTVWALFITFALFRLGMGGVSGARLKVINSSNHHVFLVGGGNYTNASCTDETALIISGMITPGEFESLELYPIWSGLICVKDISSNTTTLWANLTLREDLKLVTPCDEDNNNSDNPKMKPGSSDCPHPDCPYIEGTWSCNVDHRFPDPPKVPREEKVDGPVSSGAVSSRTKLNSVKMLFCCLVVVAAAVGW